MDWITAIWAFVLAVYVMMAGIHLVIFFSYRRLHYLMLVISALSAGIFSLLELYTIKYIRTPADYGLAFRTVQVPFTGMMVSMVWFQHLYFNVGRRSLIWLFTGMRLLILLVVPFTEYGFNFAKIESVVLIPFLNGEFPVPLGQNHPRALIGIASMGLMVVIAIDFALAVWRQSQFRQAIIVGGSVIIFNLLVILQTTASYRAWLTQDIRYALPTYSFCFLAVALAMSYEVCSEAIRASWLSRELRESELRMRMAANAAGLGIWTYDLKRRVVWLSDKVLRLLAYEGGEIRDPVKLLSLIHKEDRRQIVQTVERAVSASEPFQVEMRVAEATGGDRWLTARGEVEADTRQGSLIMRGVLLDITVRKQAELAAQSLNGMLIQAREDERARLARELHDDLSQRLALLSVEQEILGENPPEDPSHLRRRMRNLSRLVKGIMRDVNKLSHNLHPSRLIHFGLVPAIRGYCRDLGNAHGIEIGFSHAGLPERLPSEVGICLYRILQESLQNVVRHSGSKDAQVLLRADAGELCLSISDSGVGFDQSVAVRKQTLGLTGMRERVRLVRGVIKIETAIGAGTKISVVIPLITACVGLDDETASEHFIPVRSS